MGAYRAQPETWATTETPKEAALAAADSITALAAQHTWLVAENSTLRDQLAGAVAVTDDLIERLVVIALDEWFSEDGARRAVRDALGGR